MNTLLAIFLFSACAVAVQCVWVKEMENPKLWQGDIQLDPDEDERNGTNRYASIKGGRWPGGKIPYVITSSIGSRGVQAINNAISNYHQYTCLRFHKRTNEATYISFYRGGGCSSPVGYRYGRVNHISLAGGCWYTGIVMHEIGHSMGFYHEQSRPDRDSNVRIIWNNIQRDMRYNFNKFGTDVIDSLGTPYDFSSMMHYGATAFGNGRKTIQTIDPNNQRLIGQRHGFSEIDKRQLGLMYNKICQSGGGGGGGGGSCKDTDRNCSWWAKKGYCRGSHGPWMRDHCCASCKAQG